MSAVRALVLVLLSMSVLAPAAAAEKPDADGGPELLVFVGEMRQTRELDYDCGERCWNFDTGFALTYRVLDDLRGEVGSEDITFEFFGHYGLGDFAYYDKALVFAYRTRNGYVMARYLAFPVEKTTEGDWAHCGNPYADDMPGDVPRFRRVTFVQPVAWSAAAPPFPYGRASDHIVGRMKPGLTRCRRATVPAISLQVSYPARSPATGGFISSSSPATTPGAMPVGVGASDAVTAWRDGGRLLGRVDPTS